MPYTIEEHKHRFAAWAAGRGASVKSCRFKVHQAKEILEACGFDKDFNKPYKLPKPGDLDKKHRAWRKAVIRVASKKGLRFSAGIAAKLINSYLKERFVCAGFHTDPRVRALHPPIDAVLLDTLAVNNVEGYKKEWRKYHNLRWSNFTDEMYQGVIDLVRKSLPKGSPLWMIEEHWKGHI